MLSRESELTSLPSLPTVAVQILRAFQQPECDVLEIVELIQADPALAAKVLETANSTRFNPRQKRIGSLNRAVLLLGRRVLCTLALSFSLARETLAEGPYAAHYKAFWLESFVRALSAEWIARRLDDYNPDDAYTIGLLSLIGRLVMLKDAPREFSELLDQASEHGVAVEKLEDGPITSIDITTMLLDRWKFPIRMTWAVRHLATGEEGSDNVIDRDLVAILRTASVAAQYLTGSRRARTMTLLRDELRGRDAASKELVGDLLTAVLVRLEENAELFNLDLSALGTAEEILKAAREQSAELLVTGDQMEPAELWYSSKTLHQNRELKQTVDQLISGSSVGQDSILRSWDDLLAKLSSVSQRAAESRQAVGLMFGSLRSIESKQGTSPLELTEELLESATSALRGTLRGDDLLARRLDRFAILVSQPTIDSMDALAHRLRRSVHERLSLERGDDFSIALALGGGLGVPVTNDESFTGRLVALAERSLSQSMMATNRPVITPLLTRSSPDISGPRGTVMSTLANGLTVGGASRN
ncbi:MAG: HDOD domain-containing protein [Planctomycetaceae bacterium]